MAETYKTTDRLKTVIANDYRLLQVMSRFGITFGYGDKTISEACRQAGCDPETFVLVINYICNGAENRPQRVSSRSVESLLNYLKRTHQYFLGYQFPVLKRYLLNAIDCSLENQIAFLVLKFFNEYVEEVRCHMQEEEENSFLYVESLLKGELPDFNENNLLSRHHETFETKLNELKNLFMQYYPQKGNNNELNHLLIELYQTEDDMRIHCLVEDNLFTPAVKRLAKEISGSSHRQLSSNVETAVESKRNDNPLSDREKEIVACVARGMANKEIADALFLSVNTVATHRRNIARKLRIHSSAGITIYAIVNKLVNIEDIAFNPE